MAENQQSSKIVFVATIILTASIAFALFALELSPIFANFQDQNIMNQNWAGYIAFSNEFESNAVNASWTVPTVNPLAGDGYSSTWIGIGGQSDSTLIQVGTGQAVVNGQTNYNAWYETLPSSAIIFANLTIHPGDVIVASIALSNPKTNQWTIQISDITNQQKFSTNIVYASACCTIQWIVERPIINNQMSTLADFGNVTFNGCCANISNVNSPIAGFSCSKLLMADLNYGELTSVSPITADGLNFTITYQTHS